MKPWSLIVFSWNPSMIGRLLAAGNNLCRFVSEGLVKVNETTFGSSSSYLITPLHDTRCKNQDFDIIVNHAKQIFSNQTVKNLESYTSD